MAKAPAVDGKLTITYVGHATLRIEMDGVCLLTDPLLRSRVLHLRRKRLYLDRSWYQGLDAVLISHLHRDHLDLPSLRRLSKKVPLIVPQGASELLRKQGYSSITELALGENISIGGLCITSTPARHHGFRVPFGPLADCLGFTIQGAYNIYFAGDTDLFPEMADLAGKLNVALLPVWGWGPSLGTGHMDPYRAAQALQLLKPVVAIPIHWGTFYPIGFNLLDPDFLTAPPRVFADHAARLVPQVKVQILNPGEQMTWEDL